MSSQISIHALLAESDKCTPWNSPVLCYFYPRSPCGERLLTHIIGFLERVFLSTLSLRRATTTADKEARKRLISIHALLAESDHLFASSGVDFSISIHALLAESDLNQIPPRRFHYHFYPRSPCGERLPQRSADCSCRSISIHALLAESDIKRK